MIVTPTPRSATPGITTGDDAAHHTRRLSAAADRVRARCTAALLSAQEDGMTTAEYAVGTIAAVGFAGVLIKLVSTDTVRGMLTAVLTSAFAPFLG